MTHSRDAMRREVEDLVRTAAHVRVVPEKVGEVAAVMRRELAGGGASFQTDPQQFPRESPAANDVDTLQFYLVLTSQEFCIWRRDAEGKVEAWDIEIDGRRYVGARGIGAAHMRALQQGKHILDPAYLASMTLDGVKEFYRDERTGKVTLQMLPQRLAKFNELGHVLQERHDGHVASLLDRANGYLFRDDDRGIVQQLHSDFSTAYLDWPFCKLALLFAKFIATRKTEGIPTTADYRRLAQIRDAENFEIAADYYIPLFFIRVGIFRIGDDLLSCLRDQRLIERNSRMEREYRASTITAGRMLAEAAGWPVTVVDTECWKTGYLRCRLCAAGMTDEELPCPYRSISKGYQDEHGLMDLRWPLVLTTCY